MKDKSEVYSPLPSRCAAVQLSTRALFARDEEGLLVPVPGRRKAPQERNPKAEERRADLRFEWRHDGVVRQLTSDGQGDPVTARTCDLSRGGCSVLLERDVPVGAYLDLSVEAVAAAGQLPLLQVLHIRPKGNVWLVHGSWLHKLPHPQKRRLLGQPEKQAKKKAPPPPPPDSWLKRAWRLFRLA